MSNDTQDTKNAFSTYLTQRRTSLQSIVEDEISTPLNPQCEQTTNPSSHRLLQYNEKNDSIPTSSSPCSSHGNYSTGTCITTTEHRIQETADDSSRSKLSAVTLGYYEDPYLHFFVKQPLQRSPLINRGYFSRIAAIRLVIANFLLSATDNHSIIQIVNFGAGTDTLYFWMADIWQNYSFHLYEIDFPDALSKKLSILIRRQPLRERLQTASMRLPSDEMLSSTYQCNKCIKITDSYTMIPVDMKDIHLLDKMIRSSNFDINAPTLFLNECSLVYLEPSHSDAIIDWASNIVKGPCGFFCYEQIHPHDVFGRTMVRSMEQRGFPLHGIKKYPSIESYSNRFQCRNWIPLLAIDMIQFYNEFLDKYELIRVQSIELLDEMEEWKLIQTHYIFFFAVKNPVKSTPCSMESQGIQIIDKLKHLWETQRHDIEELPRFTTEEFRRNSKAIQSMYSLGVRHNSHVKPALLSFLLCPQAMKSEKDHPSLPFPLAEWNLSISCLGVVKAVPHPYF